MEILKDISEKLEKGNASAVEDLTKTALAEGLPALQILNEGYMPGMKIVGEKFKNNEIFIPEMLIAARAMKAGIAILRPLLSKIDIKAKGKVLIGTVKGDLHDIGKNLVIIMLEGAGFTVIDLGTDVSTDKFVEYIKKEKPDITAMSALLTTTMLYMKDVVDKLNEIGLRNNTKILIGGAPITQNFANDIGADGYSPDAASAAELAAKLIEN